MSAFHGRQGKGATRSLREVKRVEAEGRAADFEIAVGRVMYEQHISEHEARWVAAASRRVAREAAKRVSA